MRRLLLAVFACVPLLAIAAAPAFTIVPTVVVYPPTTSGDTIDNETTSRIATLLATEIAKGGQVKIVTPRPGVERATFLADARSLGADYYVSGFLTPIGGSASMIEQVVSTVSGTVVFSASAQVTTLSDLVSPADELRDGIVERSSRGLALIQTPQQAPSTPAPEASNAADVNVNGLFNRRKRGSAGATVPVLAPDAVVAILAVGGSAGADQRTAAAQALAVAFGRDGRQAVVVSDAHPSSTVCSANKATALVGAWLDETATAGTSASAALRLVGYDCSGKALFDRSFTENGSGADAAQVALNAASDAAVGAFVGTPKP